MITTRIPQALQGEAHDAYHDIERERFGFSEGCSRVRRLPDQDGDIFEGSEETSEEYFGLEPEQTDLGSA